MLGGSPFRLEDVMRDWKAFTARQVIIYLQDKKKPESRREWLLQLFGHFAAGRKDKQRYQVWQHDNHPVWLYSEPVVSKKLNCIHLTGRECGFMRNGGVVILE